MKIEILYIREGFIYVIYDGTPRIMKVGLFGLFFTSRHGLAIVAKIELTRTYRGNPMLLVYYYYPADEKIAMIDIPVYLVTKRRKEWYYYRKEPPPGIPFTFDHEELWVHEDFMVRVEAEEVFE